MATTRHPTTLSEVRVGAPPRTGPTRRHHQVPSWGLKPTMAVTGIALTAFVAIHLFGNLKAFQGSEAFNTYAAWLREAFYPLMPKGLLLWTTRVVILVSAFVHIGAAMIIWVRGRRARGGHRVRLHGARSRGAWLMPATGVAILVFVVFHLLDLTLGIAPAAPPGFTPAGDGTTHAYENMVASFERPLVAWGYAALMLLLALHVAKGFGTLAVDLGVMGRRLRAALAVVGGLLALAILLGNGAIPLAVQAGWLR